MKVLNFGSLNIDYTYSVPHIIVGGETMASSELHEYCGEGIVDCGDQERSCSVYSFDCGGGRWPEGMNIRA